MLGRVVGANSLRRDYAAGAAAGSGACTVALGSGFTSRARIGEGGYAAAVSNRRKMEIGVE
jgi:hypothetical protein